MDEPAATYNEVYRTALSQTLATYDRGEVLFVTEHDLQAEIMRHCKAEMLRRGFETPLRISSALAVSPTQGRGRVEFDLVLGLPDETENRVASRMSPWPAWHLSAGCAVAVEVKYERRVKMSEQRNRQDLGDLHYAKNYENGLSELACDLVRLREAPPLVVHRHFLALDEKGEWRRLLPEQNVLELADSHENWEHRKTRAGADYWVLAVELPMRQGAP